jgi:hypothetical protein
MVTLFVLYASEISPIEFSFWKPRVDSESTRICDTLYLFVENDDKNGEGWTETDKMWNSNVQCFSIVQISSISAYSY